MFGGFHGTGCVFGKFFHFPEDMWVSLIFVIRNWSGASYIEYNTVLNVKGLDPCHSDFSATCMRHA